MIKRREIFAVILAYALFVSGCTGEGQDNKANEQSVIELTQRQEDLLQEMGLSTKYDELTDTQKNAVTSIEAMLSYLEDEYQEEFCYLSYAEASALEEEQLEAYPASGTAEDVVTVKRAYSDGEYHYEDDYWTIEAKTLYEAKVQEFASSTFPETGVKVFSDIWSSGDMDWESITEDNVMQEVSAVTYIFLSQDVCTKSQFQDFNQECMQWLKGQYGGKAAQICLRLTNPDQWELLNASVYEDKLREDIFSAEAECAVSASDEVTVY